MQDLHKRHTCTTFNSKVSIHIIEKQNRTTTYHLNLQIKKAIIAPARKKNITRKLLNATACESQ